MPQTLLMTSAKSKEQIDFGLAFELAYCLHVNKEVAFFVAEDALDELPLLLGSQEKNRKPSAALSGFWKWGERTRPIRQTIKLNERQMLQWLVYKQSESWERQTERGEGLYPLTEEDMIVRYLKHLVFITLRRGSFYVTLAIGQLLHQFNRRETRLFYDILTQSDSARMKDMGYIGKQRLELLGKICQRFDRLTRTIKTPGGERQLVMRPTTQPLINLVHECLRRFTPWDTSCLVESGFDVTDIPALYYSGADSDEDGIEMGRTHTLLDPDCFARFVEGLSKYVRTLPGDNQDKGCHYDSPNERLAMPQFANFPGGPPRGDRFQSPGLTREDYIRLQRTLAARARRRKAFAPQQLCIYVDNVLCQTFDSRRARRIQFLIEPEAGVIEVRGRDDLGELTMATLLVECDQIPPGGAFKDAVAHQGGQKVEIQLRPIRDAEGAVECAQVEVSYAAPRFMRSIPRLAERVWFAWIKPMTGHREVSEKLKPRAAWRVKAGAGLAMLIAGLAFIWWQLQPPRGIRPAEQAWQPPTEEKKNCSLQFRLLCRLSSRPRQPAPRRSSPAPPGAQTRKPLSSPFQSNPHAARSAGLLPRVVRQRCSSTFLYTTMRAGPTCAIGLPLPGKTNRSGRRRCARQKSVSMAARTF